jgi:hypothetical protein
MTEKVSVAITFTADYCESGFQGVDSVIRNAHLIRDLHFVRFGHNGGQEELYDGWHEHLKRLGALGLEPTWHSMALDASKLKSLALVHIEPDLYVTESAFLTLLEDAAYPRTLFHKQQFAVSSILNVRAPLLTMHAFTHAFLAYGFLMVVLALDYLRALVSQGSYHRVVDLRAQLVTPTYPKQQRLAEAPLAWRWGWWWFGPSGSGIAPPTSGGTSCMQCPDARDQGMPFVLRTIRKHSGMGWGLWWWAGFALYYFSIALPWWTYVIGSYRPLWWMQRDMTNVWWISFYLLHCAVVGLCATKNMRFPYHVMALQTLVYPVFVTLSPLIFVYARWHTSQNAWDAPSPSGKKAPPDATQ